MHRSGAEPIAWYAPVQNPRLKNVAEVGPPNWVIVKKAQLVEGPEHVSGNQRKSVELADLLAAAFFFTSSSARSSLEREETPGFGVNLHAACSRLTNFEQGTRDAQPVADNRFPNVPTDARGDAIRRQLSCLDKQFRTQSVLARRRGGISRLLD